MSANTTPTPASHRRRIVVQGIVQGVGFRPFVYGQALHHRLGGFVQNDSHGVLIEVEGAPKAIAAFERALRDEAPPLARIDAITSESLPPRDEITFVIKQSQNGAGRNALISPDTATCADCLREIFDPTDRRYRYPFTNCTNCGPRFTIIQDVPYDRDKTTMRDFPLCPECQAEYDNPLDRRFYAQPNACPTCGPQAAFLTAQGQVLHGVDPIVEAARQLAAGALVAIKGPGGYYLACDALNGDAIQRLRRHKHHDGRPFALMVPDTEVAGQICAISAAEAALLETSQRPIVLLKPKAESAIAANVAPSSPLLGIMLPHTPLHYLLLDAFASALDKSQLPVLVMTAGRLEAGPMVFRDSDAHRLLLPITDGMLTHNRAIASACDDSVAQVVAGEPRILRRSRGYAPLPLPLPVEAPVPLLARGGGHSGIFTLVKGNRAFVSHLVSNTQHPEALRSFHEGIQQYQRLFDVQPEILVYDPDAGSEPAIPIPTLATSRAMGIPHHHAHIASVLAEYGLTDAVIGVVACGESGWSLSDMASWRCEVLIVDLLKAVLAASLRFAGSPDDMALDAITQSCQQAREESGLRSVAISGSVFQDRWPLERLIARLEGGGFQVHINRQVPPNDDGLSFGQAAAAAVRLRTDTDASSAALLEN